MNHPTTLILQAPAIRTGTATPPRWTSSSSCCGSENSSTSASPRSAAILYLSSSSCKSLDEIASAAAVDDSLDVRSSCSTVSSSGEEESTTQQQQQRSSQQCWALNSRLERLKKRHTPNGTRSSSSWSPSSSSKKSEKHQNKRSSSSQQRKQRQLSQQDGQSRWESLPTSRGNSFHKGHSTSSHDRHDHASAPAARSSRFDESSSRAAVSADRPKLPKRQQSIEHSAAVVMDRTARQKIINEAAVVSRTTNTAMRSRSSSSMLLRAQQ